MAPQQPAASASGSFPDFDRRFLFLALISVVAGGFGLAAYLSVTLGFGLPAVPYLPLLMQLHGHLQVFDFAGVMLIGVSLYVMPRLLGRRPGLERGGILILALIGAALVARICAQLLIPALFPGTALIPAGASILAASAVGELIAIFLYLITVFRYGYRRFIGGDRAPDLDRVRPFFLLMVLGWGSFGFVQAKAGLQSIQTGLLLLNPRLTLLSEDLFLFLALIPAIFAFGVRMLPVFLGLREPRWPVAKVGTLYAAGALALSAALAFPSGASPVLFLGGAFIFGAASLWYLFELDPLALRKVPERVALKQFRSDAATIRGRYGDRGEFGHFEWCIYAGYLWLIVGVGALCLHAVTLTAAGAPPLITSPIRHIFYAGFVINLILGVGLRLLPKLLGRSGLPATTLSAAIAIIFNCSVAARVLPFWLDTAPWLFGVSGVLGLAALILFAFALLKKKPGGRPG